MNETQHTIYAFAHVETWLEDYSKTHKLAVHELTERVADLLLAQTRGQVSGSEHRLSTLRGHSTKGDQTTRSMEVASGTHRKASRDGVVDKRSSADGIKAYWARMSPLQRRREVMRRLKKRIAKREAKRLTSA